MIGMQSRRYWMSFGICLLVLGTLLTVLCLVVAWAGGMQAFGPSQPPGWAVVQRLAGFPFPLDSNGLFLLNGVCWAVPASGCLAAAVAWSGARRGARRREAATAARRCRTDVPPI